MTHQPTNPTIIPATNRASNPTSTMEIQLESRLVARCGVDAMVGRSGREPTSRVDWVLPNHDDRHE